ncbi:MAG: MarR family winged helix-turn-helix transcriptional regulator [Bacteroidota bacterium]
MNDSEILKEIIHHYFNYKEAGKGERPSFHSFIGYLNTITDENSVRSAQERGEYHTEVDDVAIFIVLLYRYAKGYVNRALKDTPLQTVDEFSFLITLLAEGGHTKTDMINKMVLTKTSGTEVIKRLIKKGLISESDNPEDKRSLIINLSEEGKKVTFSILPIMQKVSEIIKGNLNSSELTTLNFLLKKLEVHHRNIYEGKVDLDVDGMIQG